MAAVWAPACGKIHSACTLVAIPLSVPEKPNLHIGIADDHSKRFSDNDTPLTVFSKCKPISEQLSVVACQRLSLFVDIHSVRYYLLVVSPVQIEHRYPAHCCLLLYTFLRWESHYVRASKSLVQQIQGFRKSVSHHTRHILLSVAYNLAFASAHRTVDVY